MRYHLIALYFLLLVSSQSRSQMPVVRREGLIRSMAADSVYLFFNRDYYLIEDSCAEISRIVRFDAEQKIFTGRFRDVLKADPQQLLATGWYDENGKKQGSFASYYLDGTTQASGKFKDDWFDGRWHFYYPGGRPRLSMEANGNEVRILNAWSEEGKKTVDNGYGDYQSVIGPLVWEGKLVGGKPDGKWIAYRMHHSSETLVTEKFKLGEFQKGRNQAGEYRDSSRIVLVSTDLLPLVKAERLLPSTTQCNVAPQKSVINARYTKGAQSFAEEIQERLAPVLNRLNLKPFIEPIQLKGKVTEDGRLVFDSRQGADASLTSSLITSLASLPLLEPAWIDGKAVQQDIVITINSNSSVYSFNYRFFPVEVK